MLASPEKWPGISAASMRTFFSNNLQKGNTEADQQRDGFIDKT